MATHWPPITIDLTEEGARIYTAGVLTTTLNPGPHIHGDAMAVVRKIAASYKRTLPVTASSPDGEFHMLVFPDGSIHTEETPTPDNSLATGLSRSVVNETASKTMETTAELAAVPHTLPHPAHTPEVLTAQSPHADEDTQLLPSPFAQPSSVQGPPSPVDTHVDHLPTVQKTPRATKGDGDSHSSHPHEPTAHRRRRTSLVIPSVLAALIAATGLAVNSLHATSGPVPASRAPSPISTFLDIPPRQTPSPRATAEEPSPTASASTPQEDATPQESAVPEEAPQPAPAQVAEHTPAQPAAPAAVDPPQTVPDVSDGLSAMNTSISAPGGGSATVTVHVQGSGTTLVSVTVGGVSTTITTTAPGSASATLTGLPTGAQSWTTSADGLVNSGTVTVY